MPSESSLWRTSWRGEFAPIRFHTLQPSHISLCALGGLSERLLARGHGFYPRRGLRCFSLSSVEFQTRTKFSVRLEDAHYLTPHPRYPEKFENAALFARLGLPSKLIRTENGAFRKRSLSQKKKLKTPALRFSVDGKHFENGAFRKRSSKKCRLCV